MSFKMFGDAPSKNKKTAFVGDTLGRLQDQDSIRDLLNQVVQAVNSKDKKSLF